SRISAPVASPARGVHAVCRVAVNPWKFLHLQAMHRSGNSLKRRSAGGADAAEPRAAAARARLQYVEDSEPGIRRIRCGRSFEYIGPDGRQVRGEARLARIRSLVIPPAWEQVWICADSNGHLQATGRDARGRKQYRYHPRWRETRDEAKYQNLVDFAKALP